MRFGNELRRRRKALGLTQREVADAASLAANHIGLIECGRIEMPRADVAKRIATALGCSLDELLTTAERRAKAAA